MAAEDRMHGAYGSFLMDPTGGASPVVVASLNKWDVDLSKDKVKVTAFGDTNQVYVDGLPDIKGSYGGWFDPEDGLVIFDAIFGSAKPFLKLLPSAALPLVLFSGKGLIDGKVSVDAGGGVSVGGSFVAAGAWVIPSAA